MAGQNWNDGGWQNVSYKRGRNRNRNYNPQNRQAATSFPPQQPVSHPSYAQTVRGNQRSNSRQFQNNGWRSNRNFNGGKSQADQQAYNNYTYQRRGQNNGGQQNRRTQNYAPRGGTAQRGWQRPQQQPQRSGQEPQRSGQQAQQRQGWQDTHQHGGRFVQTYGNNQQKQQANDPDFLTRTKVIHRIIRSAHHFNNVTATDSPPAIARLTQTLIESIKPADTNPTTENIIMGNAKIWEHETLATLEGHYKENIDNNLQILQQLQAGNWKKNFEIAAAWSRSHYGRKLSQELLDTVYARVEATVQTCPLGQPQETQQTQTVPETVVRARPLAPQGTEGPPPPPRDPEPPAPTPPPPLPPPAQAASRTTGQPARRRHLSSAITEFLNMAAPAPTPNPQPGIPQIVTQWQALRTDPAQRAPETQKAKQHATSAEASTQAPKPATKNHRR